MLVDEVINDNHPERGEMGGGSHLLMIDYRRRQGRFNEKIKERLEEYRGLREEPFG